MSVIVVTGQPGSGKTALVVDMLAHDEQFKGRPLFSMGIPDLTIDHTECPPVSEWTEMRQAPEDVSIELAYFRFPENAVIVLDEAQRIYRPRPVGSKVPPEVAAFETHRHTGVDFILLTQHPGLIDSNIRKLVGRHIHIRVTPFGRYKYEWTELGDPESSSSRELAAKERYTLPKRAFKLYKSSQLHTKIKTKMPCESPRELRRLRYLREWSHEQDEQIFPGSQRACRTVGAGSTQGLPLAVVGGRVDCPEDWLRSSHAA